MSLLFRLLCLFLPIASVRGNADKIIFTAPEALALPTDGPSLAQLHLDRISPSHPQLRSFRSVSFANTTHPHGLSSWYILHDLQPGTRYEVRVCWPATQPTSWQLEAFSMKHTLQTPALLQDLANFAEKRMDHEHGKSKDVSLQGTQSILFLRTWAAADYYSLDRDLMQSPPPVHADLILDPYLLNVFPRSLLPTAGNIACIAAVGWLVSNRVWSWLEGSLATGKAHTE